MDKTRRNFAKSVLSFAGPLVLLSACKRAARREDLRSFTPAEIKESRPDAETSDDSESDAFRPFEGTVNDSLDTELPASTITEECPSGLVDLDRLQQATEDLEISSKIYGKSGSALFAFHLPKYAHGSLKGVYLVRETGAPIAYKPIFPQLEITKFQLRAQYFDHLPLREGERFAVVFHDEGQVYKSSFLGPISFERSFRGLPVVGFLDHVPSSGLASPVVVPEFNKEDMEVWEDLANVFIGGKFHPSDDLKGFILTDLVGNLLSEEGEKFADFEKHPMILAYKFLGNMYARSFLRFS